MAQNRLFVETMNILSSYMGEIVAKSSLILHCSRLGIDPENLDKAKLQSIAAEMRKGLAIFVGVDKAETIAGKIGALEG